MITKRDYAIGAILGFLTGIFIIPVLYNIGFGNAVLYMLLPLAVPPVWVFGVWLGGFLARWMPFMGQFGKFVAVGFLNFSIDFGVLNLISLATGITSGYIVGGVNIPGFGLAAINSYLWNKLWVFHKIDNKGLFHDFPLFLGVGVAGLFINSGLVILLTTFVSPVFGVSLATWLNMSKIAATSITLVWNFSGYKFIVFRKTTPDAGIPAQQS